MGRFFSATCTDGFGVSCDTPLLGTGDVESFLFCCAWVKIAKTSLPLLMGSCNTDLQFDRQGTSRETRKERGLAFSA